MNHEHKIAPLLTRVGYRRPASWFTRLLWRSSGADVELLEHCPNSDRVKYQGLGGIVLATAALAFLSGSYAVYTIFEPKDDMAVGLSFEEVAEPPPVSEGAPFPPSGPDGSGHGDTKARGAGAGGGKDAPAKGANRNGSEASVRAADEGILPGHPPTVLLSVIIGLVWALVIFNLDRYIVSSTGHGDGTAKIVGEEWMGIAIRGTMAVMLGIVISAPLETRILKPEIDAELARRQRKEYNDLQASALLDYQRKKQHTSDEIGVARKAMKTLDEGYEAQRDLRQKRIDEKREQITRERDGTGGTGGVGCGKICQALQKEEARLVQELATLKTEHEKARLEIEGKIARLQAEFAVHDKKLLADKRAAWIKSCHKDGLLSRIKVSHDIGGLVPYMIMLMFIIIEVTPVLFKAMFIKGAHEYLEENRARVIAAHAGIEPNGTLHLEPTASGVNKEVRMDTYHLAEAAMQEELRRIETDHLLAVAVHDEYRRRMLHRIQTHLEEFVETSVPIPQVPDDPVVADAAVATVPIAPVSVEAASNASTAAETPSEATGPESVPSNKTSPTDLSGKA